MTDKNKMNVTTITADEYAELMAGMQHVDDTMHWRYNRKRARAKADLYHKYIKEHGIEQTLDPTGMTHMYCRRSEFGCEQWPDVIDVIDVIDDTRVDTSGYMPCMVDAAYSQQAITTHPEYRHSAYSSVVVLPEAPKSGLEELLISVGWQDLL